MKVTQNVRPCPPKVHNALAKLTRKIDKNLEIGESFTLRLATDSEYKQRVNGNNLYIGYYMQEWELAGSTYGPGLWVEHCDFRRQRPLLAGEVYPDTLIGKPLFIDTLLPKGIKTHINTDLSVTKKDARPVMTVEVSMYFAPGDIMCLFPKEHRKSIAGQLEQNGAIANVGGKPIWLGTITYKETEWRLALKVLDIAKEGAPGGLAKLVEGTGKSMVGKDAMDKFKSDMTVPYLNPACVSEFLTYCRNDTCSVIDVHRAHQERFCALGEAINLSNTTPDREYRSMGSMVSELTMRKLKDHCRLPNGSYPWERFVKRSGTKTVSWDLPDLLKFASVKYLAGKTSTDKTMLAIVNGGLAKNMQPTLLSLKGIIPDWDVSGAYASCQQVIDYCIGIPHTYGLHEHSKAKPHTLKTFLATHQSNLLPRKWVISVTGKINHRQTLIPSKVVTQVQINEYAENDSAHVPGDFTLTGNEIINGIITSDNLNILKGLCTQRELNSWMNLTVVAAAWYPKSHQCHTAQEWDASIASCENSVEEHTNERGYTLVLDTRSKHWFSMPLSDIITPWIAARNKYKMLMYEAQTPEDKAKHDGLQSSMKLGNNTNYGVQASPLFPIGNVVTANNITALCRATVWSSVMAANGAQVITDGFCYDINNVRKVKHNFNKERMGMHTLCTEMLDSSLLSKNCRNQFEYGGLGGSVWTDLTYLEHNSKGFETVSYKRDSELIEACEEKHKLVDELFTKHIKEFWRRLIGSELDCFDILISAHKHIYSEAYFHSQTNYSFKTISGKLKIKARGHQLSKDHYDSEGLVTTSPYKKFVTDLASNPDNVPLPQPCKIPTVLKVNAYNGMGVKSEMSKYWGIEPGDSIDKTVFIRPISLSPFLFNNYAQRESWFKRNDRLKATTGWGLEQFFMNNDNTLNYRRAMNVIHDKICGGALWLHANTAHDKVVSHPYLEQSRQPSSCRI